MLTLHLGFDRHKLDIMNDSFVKCTLPPDIGNSIVPLGTLELSLLNP